MTMFSDVTITVDVNIRNKEQEKILKYQDFIPLARLISTSKVPSAGIF